MLLSDALKEYIHRKLRDGKPSTIHQLDINVRRFGDYLGRPATTDDLTNERCEDVMYWMKSQDLEPRTCNKFRDNMQAMWTFLAKTGQKQDWPVIPKFKEPIRIPVAWTQEELRELWKACARVNYDVAGVRGADWWLALVSVCYDTGERIGGVQSLEWRNINLRTGFTIIRAEGRKFGAADKASELHATTLGLLQKIQRPTRDKVFVWDRDPTYLWKKYKEILADAGLPTDRNRMFHCIRKTAASWLEACGGDATELLGHADRRTTLKYLDPSIAKKQAPAKLLPRPDEPQISPSEQKAG